MSVNIEKLYREKKESLTNAEKSCNEALKILEKSKKDFIEIAKVKASDDWEKANNGERIKLLDCLAILAAELSLLRCPRKHYQIDSSYFRCELCGYVWDDKPRAHF